MSYSFRKIPWVLISPDSSASVYMLMYDVKKLNVDKKNHLFLLVLLKWTLISLSL